MNKTDRADADGSRGEREAALEQRIRELEQRLLETAHVERKLHESEERFRLLADHLPVGVFQSDLMGSNTFANERWCALSGVPREEALGAGWAKTLHPDDATRVSETWYAAAQELREFAMEFRFVTPAGAVHWVSVVAAPMYGKDGAPTGYFGAVTDLTRLKQTEELSRRSIAQEQLIEAQEAALAELSTPLIPLSGEIMVMPLVGKMDAKRVARVMQTLLSGISESRARIAILDITGVPEAGAQVASSLVAAAQAVRLLGAEVVLSGIRPEVAQALVGLGIELSGIPTCGSLQAAIRYALRTTRTQM